MSKYKAKKVVLESGEVFDSQHEYKRYLELVGLEEAHVISDLKRQVEFELIPKQILPNPVMDKHGRMRRVEPAVKYIADFTYYDMNHEFVVEDAKGMLTPVYKLKRRMMLQKGYQIKET